MTRTPVGVSGPNHDAALRDIDRTREELHAEARARAGVAGDEHTVPFREILRTHGLSYYPMIALGLLTVTDTFQAYGFVVLTPEISRTLGISVAAIGSAFGLQYLAIAAGPMPVAWLSQSKPRRALLCVLTGFAWAAVTLFTGFITSLAGLIGILLLDGLTTGSRLSLHTPIVMDAYPPQGRVRAVAIYNGIGQIGYVAAPLFVALLAGVFGFTWRGVFLVMGGTAILLTFYTIALRDPGFGKWDTQQIRASVHEAHGDAEVLDTAETSLGFWEICRRVLLIPTNKRLFAGFGIAGFLGVPLGVFISYFLDQRWNIGPGGRGVFFAFYYGAGTLALLLYGSRGEKQFRRSPKFVLRALGGLYAISVVLVAVGGEAPVFWLVGLCFTVSGALISIASALVPVCVLSIIPARMRPHAQGLAVIFFSVGGVIGSLLLGSIQTTYGVVVAMVSLLLPGLLAGGILLSAGELIDRDLDRMIDEIIEEEEIKRLRSDGGRLPMLACRGVDFSYGQLQVLFDVDFTVDDGEMVALLGTNGAGKSTLLKVISGIGLPSRGSVRFEGHDVTFLDAERRLKLGVTQVPGGRAVFGPMTVVENLRSYGYTLGRNRAALERAIDECFEAFPRLAERRSSLAATLSGGEQQMLGLAKALMLRPRLLLIDELSLGLAPVIVGQLLDMVRRINADGTAVVLVEQSVNIALNLVDHAYFMEKGEMRFDGRARDLLARDDLLRAVFLQGASQVVAKK